MTSPWMWIQLAAMLNFIVAPASSSAETLQEALAAAYRSSPILQNARFQQQSLDETIIQARAGLRPTASLSAQALYDRQPNAGTLSQSVGASHTAEVSLVVAQPLFTGGRTTWAVRAAEASVDAGREDLRAVEASVLFSVIQSYLDVLRDQQTLVIREADLNTLERQFRESSAKFSLGKVTRTDVAQAQAQLEAARAALTMAQAQLEISRAAYAAAVGAEPGALTDPQSLPHLPATLDEAFDLADISNPLLLQSRLKEKASRAQIAEARAAYRPTVALQGSYGALGPLSPYVSRDYGVAASAALMFNLPLLTGGVTASQLRQATAQNGGDRVSIETVHRQVVQGVAQAWNQVVSGRASVKAGEAQVKAAETALDGAQAEYGFGLRTTLDVLISDENLRLAQLSLVQSRHDAFLAEASLLQVSGRLALANLLPDPIRETVSASPQSVKTSGSTPWDSLVETVDKLAAPAR